MGVPCSTRCEECSAIESVSVQLIVAALVLGIPVPPRRASSGRAPTPTIWLEMDGIDLVVSFLGAIASWPVLLVADVCMT